MELTRDGYVATLRGVEDDSFEATAAILASLTDAYECRAVVLPLAGEGSGSPLNGEQTAWFEHYPIPLIAAITGDTSGAAATYALASDIRVAARDSTLRVAAIGSRRILRLLGEAGSVAVMEGGGRLSGEAALEAGLVSAVVDDPLAEAQRIGDVIASRGPIATRFAKEAMWRGLGMPLSEGLRMETDLTILLQSTKDRAEGVAAFVEKRPPTFKGE